MTINIREARVGDYLVTPAGKKRIGGVGSWGLELEDEYSISFLSAGYYGFTVEREEEWHECSGEQAWMCKLKGIDIQSCFDHGSWMDSTQLWSLEDWRGAVSNPKFRFRTRSAPSSGVLAEWEGEAIYNGQIRYGEEEGGAVFTPVVPTISEGDKFKVQVVKR